MSANSFINGGFKKVPLQDEFDEEEIGFKNTPATETKSNGYHKYELLVSDPGEMFNHLSTKFESDVPFSQQILG